MSEKNYLYERSEGLDRKYIAWNLGIAFIENENLQMRVSSFRVFG